jgi:peptide/nickel transport system substrate-binding protein
LETAGIHASLAPAPVATELDPYRNGTEEIGLWYWGPDYLDPAGYLVYGPGEMVGLRAGWAAGSDPKISDLVAKGYTTGDQAERQAVFEEFGRAMNADGPFVPLLQPASNIAHAPSVTGVVYNPTWTINVAALGSK